eukprot:PhM_4_TR13274/c0_g1_i2/m.105685
MYRHKLLCSLVNDLKLMGVDNTEVSQFEALCDCITRDVARDVFAEAELAQRCMFTLSQQNEEEDEYKKEGGGDNQNAEEENELLVMAKASIESLLRGAGYVKDANLFSWTRTKKVRKAAPTTTFRSISIESRLGIVINNVLPSIAESLRARGLFCFSEQDRRDINALWRDTSTRSRYTVFFPECVVAVPFNDTNDERDVLKLDVRTANKSKKTVLLSVLPKSSDESNEMVLSPELHQRRKQSLCLLFVSVIVSYLLTGVGGIVVVLFCTFHIVKLMLQRDDRSTTRDTTDVDDDTLHYFSLLERDSIDNKTSIAYLVYYSLWGLSSMEVGSTRPATPSLPLARRTPVDLDIFFSMDEIVEEAKRTMQRVEVGCCEYADFPQVARMGCDVLVRLGVVEELEGAFRMK